MRVAAALVAGRGTAGRSRLRLAARMPRLSPRLRLRLLGLITATLLLAAGYQLWLRDSELVAVEDVQVTGLSTDESERVRSALTAAARSMTTLHVDRDRLEQAVAIYPVVRELDVSADFPHGLRIHVVEHRPAAIANLGAAEVAVAGDGTLLRGLPVSRRLPSIEADGGVEGDRLAGAAALHAARVAGAAPGPLRGRLERVTTRPEDGIVVELREGPELIFGDARRTRAKWIAAARVLADPDAAGASYIDLRLPARPAAGGLPAETLAPVAPAGESLPDAGLGPTAAAPAGVPGATPDAALGADPAATGTAPAGTGPSATDPATVGIDPAAGVPPATGAPAPLDSTGAGAVAAP